MNKEKGQIIILNTLIFFFVSLVIIFAISSPIVSSIKTTSAFLKSKEAFYLANSAVEESLYRLRNNFQFASSNTIYLDQGQADIIVSDTFNGKKVEINSETESFQRNIEIDLIAGVGANFNYGVQVGNGGFVLDNNAGVNGNVYSNGSITGSPGAFVYGSAVAAAASPETIDQENEITGEPPSEIDFAVSGAEDFSQSFEAGVDDEMGKISFYIKKTGTPSSPTVRIHEDDFDSPGTILEEATLNSSNVTNNYGWVDVVLPNSVAVISGEKYWITIDAEVKNGKYYTLGAYNAYPNGKSKTGTYNSSWSDVSPSGLDIGFRTFVGVNDSVISDISVGTVSEDSAYANTVQNSTISGDLYCQTGSGNNKTCDTSRPDPETQPMPFSDANIDQFISEAESGDIISGTFVASSTTYLGPAKINGDLIIEDNLILTGTVYVDGNITFNNNAYASLSPSFGGFSGVLMSSGYIYLNNNVQFYGSGTEGSYVLLLTTSACPDDTGCGANDAININNNVGTVILNAQNGTISLSNNAGAKVLTAKMVHLSNNVVIDYESGLTNTNFSSGPSGGWNISSWQEVE